MNVKIVLLLCLAYIVLSAHFFETGDSFKIKKKKLYKYAKLLLLGAALGGKSKKIIPLPLPIPIPFKEKHTSIIHKTVPVKVHFVEERPIFIHDSYGGYGGYGGSYGGYHDNMWK